MAVANARERTARGLTYPPADADDSEGRLTTDEASALATLATSEAGRSALRKVVRDAAAAPIFHLLALVDGVADPVGWDAEVWLGAEIIAPRDDDDREMLHDALYETYAAYAASRPPVRAPGRR